MIGLKVIITEKKSDLSERFFDVFHNLQSQETWKTQCFTCSVSYSSFSMHLHLFYFLICFSVLPAELVNSCSTDLCVSII